jgi:hypothetical protein
MSSNFLHSASALWIEEVQIRNSTKIINYTTSLQLIWACSSKQYSNCATENKFFIHTCEAINKNTLKDMIELRDNFRRYLIKGDWSELNFKFMNLILIHMKCLALFCHPVSAKVWRTDGNQIRVSSIYFPPHSDSLRPNKILTDGLELSPLVALLVEGIYIVCMYVYI